VTNDLLDRARGGDADAFARLVGPYRRELQVHCYRLLGSAADAEDALQETLLSAWQGLPAFEGRASIRTWLYRVATSRCIDALRSGRRRPVPVAPPPDGLMPPEPTRLGEVLWLEPYPDDLLIGVADSAPGPEARYESREAISLAFITACNCCRRGSGPRYCSATCSASAPARPPASWTSARSRSPARSSVPARRSNGTGPQHSCLRRHLARPPSGNSWNG
jgi:RNA polymerase sigma factor (sigma-70 family)